MAEKKMPKSRYIGTDDMTPEEEAALAARGQRAPERPEIKRRQVLLTEAMTNDAAMLIMEVQKRTDMKDLAQFILALSAPVGDNTVVQPLYQMNVVYIATRGLMLLGQLGMVGDIGQTLEAMLNAATFFDAEAALAAKEKSEASA